MPPKKAILVQMCCCGCNRDASNGNHVCSVSGLKVFAPFCLSNEEEEGFGSKGPCIRCSPALSEEDNDDNDNDDDTDESIAEKSIEDSVFVESINRNEHAVYERIDPDKINPFSIARVSADIRQEKKRKFELNTVTIDEPVLAPVQLNKTKSKSTSKAKLVLLGNVRMAPPIKSTRARARKIAANKSTKAHSNVHRKDSKSETNQIKLRIKENPECLRWAADKVSMFCSACNCSVIPHKSCTKKHLESEKHIGSMTMRKEELKADERMASHMEKYFKESRAKGTYCIILC